MGLEIDAKKAAAILLSHEKQDARAFAGKGLEISRKTMNIVVLDIHHLMAQNFAMIG